MVGVDWGWPIWTRANLVRRGVPSPVSGLFRLRILLSILIIGFLITSWIAAKTSSSSSSSSSDATEHKLSDAKS